MKRFLLIYAVSALIAGFLVNPSLPQSGPSYRGDWIIYLAYPPLFVTKLFLGEVRGDGAWYLVLFFLAFVSVLAISILKEKL